MEKLLKIKFSIFFHSNQCENKEKNVLDNGQTNNIFTRDIMEKMYKI